MIGSGLKKLAQENGLRVDKGVAYGSYHGYAATFSEGAGYKRVMFTTRIPDLEGLRQSTDGLDLGQLFRVQSLRLAEKQVEILFLDNPGTLKKMQEFMDWFLPQLDASGATKANICVECGAPLTDSDPWKLIRDTAYHLHRGCSDRIHREATASLEQAKEADHGSYLSGTVGSVLGAVISAIPWALVMYMGYFASFLGLVIGWCCKKGYELLKGKKGSGKAWIITLSSLAGVVLGCLGSDLLYLLIDGIGKGELPGLTVGDIPMVFQLLFQDSDYTGALVKNILMGLFFALLGMISIFKELKTEKKDQTFSMQELH